MNDIIIMSQREISRLDIIRRRASGAIMEVEAARILELSCRQVRRLKAGYLIMGEKALAHRSRGQPGNRRMPARERNKITRLLHKFYPDFKPGHAAEKLAECHGITRDPKTIRAIMMAEGLWMPGRKKREEHRQWRQRRSFCGEMEQFDGSYHDWFEGHLPKCCLLLSVDDATSAITHGRFDEHEGVFPVFRFWTGYVLKHGKPVSIYMDRFSTYKMTQQVACDNHDLKTRFEKALETLGIEAIFALSPEAKGRVETCFGTLQDRLVKEMRLRGIRTMEEANRYLQEEFIPWYNRRYAVPARGKEDLHRALTAEEKRQLASVFSKKTERTVQNDFTVSFRNCWYQLLPEQVVTVRKRDTIIIEERLDGTVHFRLRGKELRAAVIPKETKYAKHTIPWVIAAGAVPVPP